MCNSITINNGFIISNMFKISGFVWVRHHGCQIMMGIAMVRTPMGEYAIHWNNFDCTLSMGRRNLWLSMGLLVNAM